MLGRNKPFLVHVCLSNLSLLLIPRIYRIIHRPPYELVKTEDLSNNFLSLPDIQTAYSKFKQLFLIGERMLGRHFVSLGKTQHVGQVQAGAFSLGSRGSAQRVMVVRAAA